MSRVPRLVALLASVLAIALVIPVSVSATHAWGNYHWARTANPFTLSLGDNVSTDWDPYLVVASSDWSKPPVGSSLPDVLDAKVVPGSSVKKLCSATTGTVQVCNSRYGNNGWLGVAQIWASGDHITKATVKLNDTYYSTSTYNTAAWRQMVMCQEIGHTFGLDHQDTNFNNANLGTCMDYTSDPSTNQHPNAHDYEELGFIYAHTDSTSTVGAAAGTKGHGKGSGNMGTGSAAAWGRLVAVTNGGHGATYIRDLGAGNVILTHVIWADR